MNVGFIQQLVYADCSDYVLSPTAVNQCPSNDQNPFTFTLKMTKNILLD